MMRRFPLLMMALVMAGMAVLGIAVTLFIPEAQWDPTAYYAVSIVQELLLFGVPALLMRPWHSSRIEQQPTPHLVCLGAFVLGYSLQVALWPVNEWWMNLTGSPPSYLPMPENPADWLLMLAGMTVVPALAEEAFFRGGLLSGLLKKGGGKSAAVLTALFFALMHMQPGGLIAHLISSFLFTVMMLRWGRIHMPVLAHFGFNLAALTASMLGCGMPESIASMLLVLVLLYKLMPGISWIEQGERRSAGQVIGAAALLMLLGAGYVLDIFL